MQLIPVPSHHISPEQSGCAEGAVVFAEISVLANTGDKVCLQLMKVSPLGWNVPDV